MAEPLSLTFISEIWAIEDILPLLSKDILYKNPSLQIQMLPDLLIIIPSTDDSNNSLPSPF